MKPERKPKLNADAQQVVRNLRKSLLRQSKNQSVPEAEFLPVGIRIDDGGFSLKWPTEAVPPAATTTNVHALSAEIGKALQQLVAVAETGNREAVEELATLARCSADHLETLASDKPALV